MISFLLCLAILIVGYFVYGKIVDNTFGPDDPKRLLCASMTVWTTFGCPVEAVPRSAAEHRRPWPHLWCHAGALWGPVVFLGSPSAPSLQAACTTTSPAMMDERNDGASIAEITGKYLWAL